MFRLALGWLLPTMILWLRARRPKRWSAVANHSTYDSVWKNPNYTPDSNWTTGTTGVGYGQTSTDFYVRTYQANIASNSPIGTTLDDLDETFRVIGNPSAYTSTAAGNYGTVNFLNTGTASDSGHYGNNVQFPGQVKHRTTTISPPKLMPLVTIPSAGDWTFGVRSNEGFLLSVDDLEISHNGAGSGSTVDSLSTFHFDAAGVYNIDLYHFERSGDAWLELFTAPGSADQLEMPQLRSRGGYLQRRIGREIGFGRQQRGEHQSDAGHECAEPDAGRECDILLADGI